LFVAISQTVVKRQFRVLSILEVDNRLHGSVRCVCNLLIRRCNGPYFDQYVAGRAQVLGKGGFSFDVAIKMAEIR
jgi:hypothetical protein